MPTERDLRDDARRRARALHNELLAFRLTELQRNRRVMDKHTADAVLAEASRRLTWKDAYEKGSRINQYGEAD